MNQGEQAANRSGALLLLGGAAGGLATSLSGTHPAARVEVAERWESSSGSASVVAMCPSNSEELNSMLVSLKREVEPDAVLVLVSPVVPDASSADLPPIVLTPGPFVADILLNLFPFRFPPSGKGEFYSVLSMSRNGMLLPFFVHNLNNILTRVMGNIELAGFQLAETDKVRSRLARALEGAEELRAFLGNLVELQVSQGQEYRKWTVDSLNTVLELGTMSSGTSVEFEHPDFETIPPVLDVDCNQLNALLGCITSSATICVNGCGRVRVRTRTGKGEVHFQVDWKSASGDAALSDRSVRNALLPLSTAAVFAPPTGIRFRLGDWDCRKGTASLSVPVPEGSAS